MKQRISPRRDKYDYTSPGWYFITICTKNRKHYFGEIENGTMILNELGKRTRQCRNDIPNHHPYVDIHEFICMPNHIHGLLIIRDHVWKQPIFHDVGTQDLASDNRSSFRTNNHSSLPIQNLSIQCKSQSLGSIIRWFKIGVTKYANEQNIIFARQWRYHDHIIRNEDSYNRIKYYIQTNPQNRSNDSLR